MAIPEAYKKNFDTLIQATKNGDICLVECVDKKTGAPVIAVCAMNRDEDESVELAPLARLFDGNPFEELIPPTVPGHV